MTRQESPASTLRLQLEPRFTLADAAEHVPYFASLGVSHLYLSPILQASPGSTHGYDVTDHSQVSEELGGDVGLRTLAEVARSHGLGIVVDVVPNHMTTPTPLSGNAALWRVLRDGRESPYAAWFDIDWDAQDGRILLPVLGAPLGTVLDAGEIALGEHEGEQVVRYYDHLFPVAAGTEGMPLGELLEAQHYRLADWRIGGTELNYRRFFDVTSLIAVRVELPEVFDATHAHLVSLVREGVIDGLRIDHPDGLADPAGYLARLADQTDGAWVAVEKILEGHETLPRDWACAGTTGYDALLRVGGLFVDPGGERALTSLSDELLGEHQDLEAMVIEAKEYVVANVLEAEVNRLLRLLESTRPELREGPARRALEALLVAMDRYRAYLRPGEEPDPEQVAVVRAAAERARAGLAADDHAALDALDAVVQLAVGEGPSAGSDAADDFLVRFQQTCGPVMAKGIEDTTFYRYVRLTSLNEVGGDPDRMGVPTAEFHDFCQALACDWPTTMTTLSTHDTKRSEDVRARLAVLSERPEEWADWLRTARAAADPYRSSLVDPAAEYLLWQALVGAGPVTTERLAAYAVKATKEAKTHTSWTDPDTDYEAAVEGFVTGIVEDPDIIELVEGWHAETAQETRANVLGQKIVQLTMPGVPDVYQGTELVDLSLVDPDNRRPVDHAAHAARLARLDAGAPTADLDDEKLLVTSTALRLRRTHSEAFTGPDAAHVPLATTSDHLVAYARGPAEDPEVVVLATRLAGRLADGGGWAAATLVLPPGEWRDAFTGRSTSGGEVPVGSLLVDGGLPVALLTKERKTT